MKKKGEMSHFLVGLGYGPKRLFGSSNVIHMPSYFIHLLCLNLVGGTDREKDRKEA